jgi:hypothetical protein
MTSSGQVTIPEAMPAIAPHNPFTVLSDKPTESTANLEYGTPKVFGPLERLLTPSRETGETF